MLAWLSALLVAAAVEGEILRPKLKRLPQSVLVSVLLVSCLAAVSWPPSLAVLKRLYGLPSSALAPFIARLYRQSGPVLHLVHRRYLASPWLQPRDALPARPASGALVLPAPRTVILLTIDALRADVVADRIYLLPTGGALPLPPEPPDLMPPEDSAAAEPASSPADLPPQPKLVRNASSTAPDPTR